MENPERTSEGASRSGDRNADGRDAEIIRQRTLAAMDILDTAPESEFDTIVKAARRLFACRTAYIALIDTDRQWFKAREGIDISETSRDCSICAVAVENECEIVIRNLQEHPVYGQFPQIAAMPELQFFATVPVRGPTVEGDSVPIGTLCVIDDRPREASEQELSELRQLASIIEALFKARLDAKLAASALAERKFLIDDLHRTHRQFELAESMARLGHWSLDLADETIFWSKQTCAIHGVEEATAETVAKALEFYLPHERQRMTEALEKCRQHGTPFDMECDFRDAQGTFKRVRAMGEMQRIDGKPAALIGVFQDITRRHELETRLRAAAHSDDLTGLPNRARLNQYLDEAIIRARKTAREMAVLLIDLDRFKEVNDQLGHEAGDRVLKEFARKLTAGPFKSQLAARLGGDEFVLVIESEDLLADLDATLDRLLARLRLTVGEGDAAITVSGTIGVAWLTPGNADRSALLRCADYALYQAKRRERGTAAICPEEIAGKRQGPVPRLRAVK